MERALTLRAVTASQMVRRFLWVSHTVPPRGDWGLDDLAGAAGRVDVLCRSVQSTLFLSHGLRQDTEVLLVFAADASLPVALRLSGADLRGLHPDERAIAGLLRTALRARPADAWWHEVRPGLAVAPFDLAAVVDAAGSTGGTTGAGHAVVLHKDGAPLDEAQLPTDPLFVLGDHTPLTDAELDVFADAPRISLGNVWYHGNHVASVLQYTLDRREAARSAGAGEA